VPVEDHAERCADMALAMSEVVNASTPAPSRAGSCASAMHTGRSSPAIIGL